MGPLAGTATNERDWWPSRHWRPARGERSEFPTCFRARNHRLEGSCGQGPGEIFVAVLGAGRAVWRLVGVEAAPVVNGDAWRVCQKGGNWGRSARIGDGVRGDEVVVRDRGRRQVCPQAHGYVLGGIVGGETSDSGVADSVRHMEGVLVPRVGRPYRIGGSHFRGISQRRMQLRGGHHTEKKSRVVQSARLLQCWCHSCRYFLITCIDV